MSVKSIGLDQNARSTLVTATRSVIKSLVAVTIQLLDALCVPSMLDVAPPELVNVYLIGKDITVNIMVVSVHQSVVDLDAGDHQTRNAIRAMFYQHKHPAFIHLEPSMST